MRNCASGNDELSASLPGIAVKKDGVASLAYAPAIHPFLKRWITGSERSASAR
jgi:hypothetical protein